MQSWEGFSLLSVSLFENMFFHRLQSNWGATGLNRYFSRYFVHWQWFSLFWLLFHELCRKSQGNLISLTLTPRNFYLWIIEITFRIQKGPTSFFLLDQTQFIMFMHYLIRYLGGWSCATKFNLLKNCVALSLENSEALLGSTGKPGQHEYSPAG